MRDGTRKAGGAAGVLLAAVMGVTKAARKDLKPPRDPPPRHQPAHPSARAPHHGRR